jgi:hypothetical protein
LRAIPSQAAEATFALTKTAQTGRDREANTGGDVTKTTARVTTRRRCRLLRHRRHRRKQNRHRGSFQNEPYFSSFEFLLADFTAFVRC